MGVPTSITRSEGDTASYDGRPRGLTAIQSVMLLVSLAALTGLPALTIVLTTNALKSGGAFLPEIVLPVVLIVGLISLLAVLVSLVAVYRRFDLVDPKSPLGMPAGSIQAVIALSLILIFAIVGVYLHGISGRTEDRTTTGMTRAQVDALPPNSIVRIHVRRDKKFDVKRRVPTETEQQDDISKQLLTTISTLVVAVAGFYFGSKTVKEATESVRGRREDGGADEESADDDVDGGDAGDAEEVPTSDVDEAAIYGDQSGTTGLSADDLDEALESPPLTAEGEAAETLDQDDDDDDAADAADLAADEPEDREPGGET